jgi:hypothetical protein
MTVQNYAYYDTQSGLIENILAIEESVAPTLVWPPGFAIVLIPTPVPAGKWSMCQIGWSYINGQFIEPPNPNAVTTLTADVSDAATTLPVADASTFFTSGSLTIDQEMVTYSGTTATSFTGVVRGVNGTTATAHTSGTDVKYTSA